MMTQRIARLALVALLAGGVTVATAGMNDGGRSMDERYGADRTATGERIAPLDTTVRIEEVRTTDDEVTGRIVNETGDQLDDVRLLIADHFLWKNERHPGAESPSDAHTLTVSGPIPPHGEKTFRFRRPSPLPDRRDGRFDTQVSALEATRRPAMAERPYGEGDTYQSRGYDRRSAPLPQDEDRYRYDER
jgi:hypothetical protein